MTRDEISARIVDILAESFELEPDEIQPESTLYEDLDLDSIDAIDIFVQLREITGRRPDPQEARQIRTVDELVVFVEAEIAKGPEEDDGSPPPDPRELFGGGGPTGGDSGAPGHERAPADHLPHPPPPADAPRRRGGLS